MNITPIVKSYPTVLTINLFDSLSNFRNDVESLALVIPVLYEKNPELMFKVVDILVNECRAIREQLDTFQDDMDKARQKF